MLKSIIDPRALLILICVLFMPVLASAQANRTWVSGVGDDMNPCSRTAPCKTFAGAIFKTNMGGEIDCLDPGGFGVVTISKSITIDGSSVIGGILSGGTNGIVINITAASDIAKTVRLRKLSINGLSTGTNTDGIRVTAAAQVFVDDVIIDGFTRHGINIGASSVFVQITNSTIRNVGQSGIHAEPGGTSPSANVSVESSSFSTCDRGLFAGRGANVAVRNGTFLHNQTGVDALKTDVMLEHCLVAHGGRGLTARPGGTVRLSLTTITNNQVGLVIDQGKIISFSNNVIHGNATDGTPSSTIPTN